MNHPNDGFKIDDMNLETVNAAGAISDLVAFGYGFIGVAAAPLHATFSEIFKPGSFGQVIKDYYSGKFMPK
ncbi:hypothetical protein KTQ42_11895|uniref:hypothetical protein n=1 Tax=Noviherbaspirillum sp. L7-7A TaxID=2850560 RepID=UPI001C2C5B12|nr:hypothetical protein [Noviherbaspirillum sp. L7-7A]MBV0880006.1 hypothetical protein [Noviherbaspirillum sp. L7-7A]